MELIMDETNTWEFCDSLRYGFDDTYDPPIFEDEKEENER